MRKPFRLLGLWALVALPTGCATTLSTMQTAVPVERKHVQVTGGYGVYIPTGPIADVVGQGVKQASRAADAASSGEQYTLSEEDQQALLTAGIALATMPPGAAYEISVRTGIIQDLDVGLRYSTNTAVRLDAKYRFFHAGWDTKNRGNIRLDQPPPSPPPPSGSLSYASSDAPVAAPASPPPAPREDDRPGLFTPSYDAAIGLGAGKHFFSNKVFELLDYVQLGDFNRFDIEVPLYLSIEWGQILKMWAAPKYVYSHTSFDEKLVKVASEATNLSGFDVSLPAEVDSHFMGSSIGFGAGYKYVHVMLELTAGYTYCRPVVFGQQRNLGGVTLYPAAAINVRI